jgi:hypothetical protein
MRKISTVAKSGNEILKEPKLTIGLDLGDRTNHYCILDEAGKDFGTQPTDDTEGNPPSLQQDRRGAGNVQLRRAIALN